MIYTRLGSVIVLGAEEDDDTLWVRVKYLDNNDAVPDDAPEKEVDLYDIRADGGVQEILDALKEVGYEETDIVRFGDS